MVQLFIRMKYNKNSNYSFPNNSSDQTKFPLFASFFCVDVYFSKDRLYIVGCGDAHNNYGEKHWKIITAAEEVVSMRLLFFLVDRVLYFHCKEYWPNSSTMTGMIDF